MGSTEEHQKLVNKIELEVQKAFKEKVFIQKRVVGLFRTITKSILRVGLKGQSDLCGYINGKGFELEIKTGNAVQNKEQKNWEATCKKLNVFHEVVRPDEVDQTIEKLRGLL